MRYSRSKYWKHRAMMKSAALAPSLPETRRLGREAFRSMLDRHRHVIVKPVGAWGGDGVVSVSAEGDRGYEVRSGKSRKTFDGTDSAYAYLRKLSKGRSHIVQQRIPLATVNGKPFDLRVMVQRKKGSPWVVTGKLAKVAGAGFLITNVRRSGGKVISYPDAFRRSNIRGASMTETERRIDALAVAAAEQLERYYPVRICGLDVGLDDKGGVWIIEANFTPYNGLFLKLKDRSMYRRIMAYAKQDNRKGTKK
ncbi:hypothetical protein FE782_27525 [Paenibacillus antri]|uniref:ATP-grasp domain-containing protein n=1 Tax=Paenibacillus antri TaxID=2582848 RepID=A0A5R9G1Y2_9BACL|nr:YheC/YheD family protein [Paenibacillus antri]TLS49029.1 hypothetical protein FE782_27525 [Paenibacillus antri]